MTPPRKTVFHDRHTAAGAGMTGQQVEVRLGRLAERNHAHLAARMGIVAADNATGHPAADDRTVVPACVCTHPEVASVGLSQARARAERGRNVRVGRFMLRAGGMAGALMGLPIHALR